MKQRWCYRWRGSEEAAHLRSSIKPYSKVPHSSLSLLQCAVCPEMLAAQHLLSSDYLPLYCVYNTFHLKKNLSLWVILSVLCFRYLSQVHWVSAKKLRNKKWKRKRKQHYRRVVYDFYHCLLAMDITLQKFWSYFIFHYAFQLENILTVNSKNINWQFICAHKA